MFLRSAIPVACAVILLGCTEYVQVQPDQLERQDGKFLVMTSKKEIYELRKIRFLCDHLVGVGERHRASEFSCEEFQGRIPYETVTFLARERFSLPKSMYAVVWILTFFGFCLLLKRGRTDRLPRLRLHSPALESFGEPS
jgi:hypothetical protein